VGVVDRCEERAYVDVALVLDMSTSMLRQAQAGRAKYVLAQEAAVQFVRLLALAPDGRGNHDQAGIVGFNEGAWVQRGLTRERAALEAAIRGLGAQIREGTRLDLGLQSAREALTGAGRRAGNRGVVVLLTDGIPTGCRRLRTAARRRRCCAKQRR
jgi:Mg-chelatase subunit ChlD